jgi:phage protein U
MLIGSWGPLVFEVSGVGALTFSEITQDASGRWASHETINTAPLAEFLGPGQDEAEIKIILTKMFGTDPKDKYESLREAVRKGQNYPLILKGTPLSGNLWYIERITGVSSAFAGGTGDILWMEMTCQFKEYR